MLRGKKQKPIHMKEKEQYENINQSTNKMVSLGFSMKNFHA